MTKYLNLGLKQIDPSLFNPIKDNILNPLKPQGGLWFSLYNELYPNYNEWIDFITYKPSIYFYKYASTTLNAIIITLKNNANIYYLDSKEKFQELKQKYPFHNYFSYEALSHDYDAIFINPYFDNKFLDEFDIKSLILFNLDVILNYKEAFVEIDPFFYNNPESSYTINIKDNKTRILKKN